MTIAKITGKIFFKYSNRTVVIFHSLKKKNEISLTCELSKNI